MRYTNMNIQLCFTGLKLLTILSLLYTSSVLSQEQPNTWQGEMQTVEDGKQPHGYSHRRSSIGGIKTSFPTRPNLHRGYPRALFWILKELKGYPFSSTNHYNFVKGEPETCTVNKARILCQFTSVQRILTVTEL
jgi:hypothetical protein